MNCFDCHALARTVPAVAVCADCGAGVCAEHAHLTARWLTPTMAINRPIVVNPPARTYLHRVAGHPPQPAGCHL